MRLRAPAPRLLTALLLLPLTSASAMEASAALTDPVAAATPSSTTAVSSSSGTTIDGPDVSSYQHPNGAAISWPAVRKAGKEFAIVKTTEGTSYVNPYFAHDYAGAYAAGLVRGSYHFARPARPIASTAAAQASRYVSRLGALKTVRTLPPALDLEVSGGLSPVELVLWAQDFLLEVRKLTGRTPMIYSYPYFWAHNIANPGALARYPLWMASYSSSVDPSAALWQYSQTASVSGIHGGVDMSRLMTGAAWPTLSDGTVPVAWPASPPAQVQQLTAVAGVRSAAVRWRTPDAGTAPITGYLVRVVETGQQVFVGPTATSATIGGLTIGGGYTMSVTPRNAVGSGPTASSGQVVPVGPVSLVTVASATSVDYGSGPVFYVGTLRDGDTGAPLTDSPVQIFSRPLGSSTWTLLQRATTDAAGNVRQTVTSSRSYQLRMFFPGTVTRMSASTATLTLVRQTVAAHLVWTHLHPGVKGLLVGTVTPGVAGAPVYRQVRRSGTWVTVSSTTTTSLGRFRFGVGAPRPTSATMRVLVGAYGGRAQGWSAPMTLTVS